ncbi:hypothetical protein ACMFMG_002481 [Clarireedia jacksonii]
MTSTTFTDQVLQTYQASITAWLPISTAWPLTTQCSSLVYIGSGKDAGRAFGWDPLYGKVIDTNAPLCLPREVTSWWFGTSYSIGPTFNCPQAYTTALTSVPTPGVTEIFCCPSQYDFVTALPSHNASDYPSQCMSTLTSGDILHYQSNTGGIMQPTSLTMSDTFLVHGQHVNGFNIDSKVFAEITAPPVTSTSTTRASNSATAISTNFQGTALETASSSAALVSSSSKPLENKKEEKSETPVGAIGVGIAVGVVVLMVAGAGMWFWRRRRRMNEEGGLRIGSEAQDKGLNRELSGNRKLDIAGASDRPMRMVNAELSAERRIGELDGGGNGNERGYWNPMKSGATERVYEI